MTKGQIHIGDMSHETAIGILKLMLEAMETYDSISPKPERVNAVKMGIEALEQEPKSEWQKDHELLKAYSDGANEMLDKIRAEIESKREKVSKKDSDDAQLRAYYYGLNDGLKDARDIIDKYRGESEET